MPHNSRTLTIPTRYATNFIALKIQALNVVDKKSYFSPIKSLNGSIESAMDQNTAK